MEVIVLFSWLWYHNQSHNTLSENFSVSHREHESFALVHYRKYPCFCFRVPASVNFFSPPFLMGNWSTLKFWWPPSALAAALEPRLLWQFIRLNCPAPRCCYFHYCFYVVAVFVTRCSFVVAPLRIIMEWIMFSHGKHSRLSGISMKVVGV